MFRPNPELIMEEKQTVYEHFYEASKGIIAAFSNIDVTVTDDESYDIERVFDDITSLSPTSQLDISLSDSEVRLIAAVAMADTDQDNVSDLVFHNEAVQDYDAGDAELIVFDALEMSAWYVPRTLKKWDLN